MRLKVLDVAVVAGLLGERLEYRLLRLEGEVIVLPQVHVVGIGAAVARHAEVSDRLAVGQVRVLREARVPLADQVLEI